MATTVLSTLANETRLKLLVCLSNGEKNVTELIGNCDLSQSAVSQHLEKLRSVGLVATEKRGKEIFYRLGTSETAKISQDLLSYLKEINK